MSGTPSPTDLRDSFDIDESADRHAAARSRPVGTSRRLRAVCRCELAFWYRNAGSRRRIRSADTRSGTSARRKQRRKAPWWELPALVALAIVIAILVKTFLVQPFYIPSQSMEKTLHGCPGCSGDRILVSKIVYDFRDPHPGDIVVFNAPPGWDDEPPQQPPTNPVLRFVRGFGQLVGFVPPDGLVLVKRVIAVGGQTVKGDAAGHVYISDNGTKGPYRKLDETYVYESGPDPRAKFGPITVPKGRLWVMGDHRDESADSRYHCGSGGQDSGAGRCPDPTAATVPIDDVIGKAVLIAWPPSRWTTLGTPEDLRERVGRTGRKRTRPGGRCRARVLRPAPPAQATVTIARVGGRLLLVDASQRLLLIHERLEHGGTHWLTPGGGVENGEHPREAARREAIEETGLEVDLPADAEAVLTTRRNWSWHDTVFDQVDHFFLARVADGSRGAPTIADRGRAGDLARLSLVDGRGAARDRRSARSGRCRRRGGRIACRVTRWDR